MSQLKWRSALCLCFMILHHDLIIAGNHVATHVDRDVVYDSQGPVYIGHDFAELHDDVVPEHKNDNLYSRTLASPNASNLTRSLQKTEGGRRRLFGLILLLVSLVTTFASIGLDAYVSVKGCAGLYPSLKTFQDEFEAKKRDLEMRADRIDKKEIDARDMKQRIEDASDAMGGIWEEIQRISKLQEEILQALDPDIIIALNNRSYEIAKEVRSTQNAAQEWSFTEIDGRYDGLFSSTETIIATFGSSLASVMGPIVKASFKYYKLNKISSTLKATNAKQILNAAPKAKALLGFTDDAIKTSLKASSSLKILSRTSGATKALKFLKGAGAVLSIVSIGVDIFSIVSTILECRNRRDKARESLEKLKEAEKEAVEAEREVNAYCDEVTTFWEEKVHPEVRSESLIQALRGVKDLVQSAMSKNDEMRTAVQYIDQFVEQINESNSKRTNMLLKNLFTGLTSVEFTMACFTNKAKVIGHAIDGCKKGKGTLDELYASAIQSFPVNSGECQTRSGLVYTSMHEISTILRKAAQAQGFHSKCPLNSKDLKLSVCLKKQTGLSVKQIGQELNISEGDVNVIAKKCSSELTPNEKKIVCSLRKQNLTDEVIANTMRVSVKKVQKVSC